MNSLWKFRAWRAFLWPLPFGEPFLRYRRAPKETDFQNSSTPKNLQPFNGLRFQSLTKKYGVNPTNGLLSYEKSFTGVDLLTCRIGGVWAIQNAIKSGQERSRNPGV